MTDEFTIQCQSCGTYYNDLQDVCPYCGEPQPASTQQDIAPVEEALLPDEPAHEFYAGPFIPGQEDAPADEFYLPAEAAEDFLPDAPFIDDDIFAVAGATEESLDELIIDDEDSGDDYEQEIHYPYPVAQQLAIEPPNQADGLLVDNAPAAASRFTWRRILSGCLGLVICGILLYGGIGLLAVREGLQERAQIAQTESQAHYERGQEHLANNAIELAIAEFEQAIKLNPNFTEARQALREAQRIAQAQPTPTSQTRSAAAADLLAQAKTQLNRQEWAMAVQTFSQVRDLDPDYNTEEVSEALYQAHYQLGLQAIASSQLEAALDAFENALAERPNDPDALAEQANALLYLDGLNAQISDPQNAVEIFNRLYRQDETYLDVKEQLFQAYQLFGDQLAGEGDWCQAQVQYTEANTLRPGTELQAKLQNSETRCRQTGPVAGATTPPAQAPAADTNITAPQATATLTPTTQIAPSPAGAGSIVFSAFNINEARWEIVSLPVAGGEPKVLVVNATMPAVSPNAELLLYHSELVDSEGLHVLNLTTGQDQRLTTVRAHILPRWGGSNTDFIFVAQEGATGRWLVHHGFADGKSDPVIIGDGRTPDWSSDNGVIAYQGTDPEGNNPGIYLVPFEGGKPTRLTNHESDRSPAFSPNGSQLAYMSTRSGNWDIFVASTAGSAPRQLTTAAGNDGLPVWSPDGNQIAYVSDSDGSWAIYAINAGGGSPTKITEWDGAKRPDWLLSQIWWTR